MESGREGVKVKICFKLDGFLRLRILSPFKIFSVLSPKYTILDFFSICLPPS